MNKIKTNLKVSFLLIGFFSLICFLGFKRGDTDQNQDSKMIMLTPPEMVWGKGPASLPPGAEVTVLNGDPSKKGIFTMRLKMPAGYKVPPHWHPETENVAVLSGSLMFGHGDNFDESKMRSYEPGSFLSMPAKMHHFAMSKEECVIQLHAMGPWGITYINPADDPSKK